MKVFQFLVVTALMLVFFFTSCSIFKKKYEEIPPDLPDIDDGLIAIADADYDWQLQGLDGTEIDFARFAGKAVFLNFWETWCMPCRLEMPKIENLYNACRESVEFVLVSPEDLSLIRRFADSTHTALPLYRLNSELPAVFRGTGVPRTFILNEEGAVVFSEFRSARWDDESCVRFLEHIAE